MPKSAVTTRAVVSARINSSEPRGKRGNETQPHGHERLRCAGGRWEGRGGHGAWKIQEKRRRVFLCCTSPNLFCLGGWARGERREERGEESLLAGRGREGRGLQGPLPTRSARKPFSSLLAKLFVVLLRLEGRGRSFAPSFIAFINFLCLYDDDFVSVFVFVFWGGEGEGEGTLYLFARIKKLSHDAGKRLRDRHWLPLGPVSS